MLKVAVILFVVVMLAVAAYGKPQLHQHVPQLGLSSFTRIVHGEDAKIADYPYQVHIKIGPFSCGGSIISTNFVLTAAHCFKESLRPSDVIVRAGSSQCIHTSGGQNIGVKKINKHPNYNDCIDDYDCAVVELASSLIFGECVQPIQLQRASYDISDGQWAILTGWVDLGKGESSDILQVVSIPLLTTETCQIVFGSYITSRKICAGPVDKTACFGNSGGPLVINRFQVGIESNLITGQCGEGPTAYTKVSEMLPFINQFVKTY